MLGSIAGVRFALVIRRRSSTQCYLGFNMHPRRREFIESLPASATLDAASSREDDGIGHMTYQVQLRSNRNLGARGIRVLTLVTPSVG